MCVFFDMFCVFIDHGLECVWGLDPWRGFKFSVRGTQIEFKGIFKQKEQFNPNNIIYFESCVDFEVANLSICMVQRLS